MHCLRLFIVVLQELHCLLKVSLYCVSELHGHICPYHNVLPEAVYCCFTGTTWFTKLFTCLYDQS